MADTRDSWEICTKRDLELETRGCPDGDSLEEDQIGAHVPSTVAVLWMGTEATGFRRHVRSRGWKEAGFKSVEPRQSMGNTYY